MQNLYLLTHFYQHLTQHYPLYCRSEASAQGSWPQISHHARRDTSEQKQGTSHAFASKCTNLRLPPCYSPPSHHSTSLRGAFSEPDEMCWMMALHFTRTREETGAREVKRALPVSTAVSIRSGLKRTEDSLSFARATQRLISCSRRRAGDCAQRRLPERSHGWERERARESCACVPAVCRYFYHHEREGERENRQQRDSR